MASASRNEGRLFCERVDPTGSNSCCRYLMFSVCRSEQQVNRGMSLGALSERCRAPSVRFTTLIGLLSLRNVCLSVCLRLPATTHYSDRCNNAFLIYESVVEVLLRKGCVAICLRLESPHRAFTSHHVSVCLPAIRVDSSQRLSACDSVRALCLMPQIKRSMQQ